MHQTLGLESGPAGLTRILLLEDRERSIPDQLQDIAAGLVDGGDDRFRIIVQKRDDLFGVRSLRNVGETMEVAEPQDSLDPVRHAPGDASVQNEAAGVAAEIGLDKC